MTNESKYVIALICRDRLWESYETIEPDQNQFMRLLSGQGAPDERIRFVTCDGDYFTVCLSCESLEERERVSEAIEELHNIFVKEGIAFGKEQHTTERSLLRQTIALGSKLYVAVDRRVARVLFDRKYLYTAAGGVRETNFLTYINRNNGKHWDDLLSEGSMRNIKLFTKPEVET